MNADKNTCRVARLPPSVTPSVAAHDKSGLITRSGIAPEILPTTAPWEASIEEIASPAVALRKELDRENPPCFGGVMKAPTSVTQMKTTSKMKNFISLQCLAVLSSFGCLYSKLCMVVVCVCVCVWTVIASTLRWNGGHIRRVPKSIRPRSRSCIVCYFKWRFEPQAETLCCSLADLSSSCAAFIFRAFNTLTIRPFEALIFSRSLRTCCSERV